MVASSRYIKLHPLDLVPEITHLGPQRPNIQGTHQVNRRPCESHHRYQLECEGPAFDGYCQYGLWNQGMGSEDGR